MKRILHQIKSKIALNKHKLRRSLITFGVFIALAGGFLFYTNNASAAPWWTGGGGSWGARKQLTVANNSSSSLSSGTPIAISIDTSTLVASGKLRADCADLRILYQPSSTTTTELTRHLVFPGSTTCATSTATKVYFKIQASLASSATSTDYYLYYKNMYATVPTSTEAAFNISSATAMLVCPFNGTTTCAAGETPSTSTGAIRYNGTKSALSFDRTGDYVSVPLAYTVPQLTVEFWFNPNNLAFNDGDDRLMEGSNIKIGFYNSGGNYLRSSINNGTTISYNASSLSTNTWHHLAIVYTGTTHTMYLDGRSVASGSQTGTVTLSSTYGVGSTNFLFAGSNFEGKLDEVRVSNKARYVANFTPSTIPFVRDDYTKLLLHMDENGDEPHNTGKAIDDSGNGNHGTITGAKYVTGLVGADSSSTDTGNLYAQSYAGHEGVFIEEGTTNNITNPNFENSTYDTNWTAGSNITAFSNTSAPFVKFGVNSAKLAASASAISGTSNMFTTSINVGSTAVHTMSMYVYDGTSGNVGGTISSSIAKIVFNGTAQTTTYTDEGSGWWRLTYSVAGINGSATYGVEAQVSKTIYVDGAQLEPELYATSYADGSFGSGYAWSSTENNSTSTRTGNTLAYSSTNNIQMASGTISMWAKIPHCWNRTNKAYNVAGTLLDTYPGGGWGIRLGFSQVSDCASTGLVTMSAYMVPNGSITLGSASINKWIHYTLTWDGSTMKGYTDGLLSGTDPSYSSVTLHNITLGNGANSAGSQTISDLRIYDNALTDTQVTDVYQAGLVGHSQGRQVDAYSDTKGEDPVGIYHADEAQGTTLNDSSKYENTFTLGTGSSAPSWESVHVQSDVSNPRAINVLFDGSNDYAYSSYDTDFDPGTDSFSVSGYFRHPSTIAGTDTILARYGSAGYKVYMDSSGYICFGIDDDSTWGPDDSACSTASQGSLADSKWHTYTAVKTSTTSIALYIDGILVGSDSSLAATATLNPGTGIGMYFGIDSNFTSNPWLGNLDELYFYSYARSAAQIKTDVQGRIGAALGTSIDSFSNGLLGYWKMNESSGNISDVSGNSNTLTNNGTTTFVSGRYGNGSEHVPASSQYFSASSTIAGVKTVAFWVNPDSTTNYYGSLTSGAYITSSSGTLTATGFTAPKIYVNGVESSTIAADVWQYVVVTTDTAIAADQFYIGRQDANYFDGTFDETRLYNRAFSSKEIQRLYNFAPGPLVHYRLDENTGTTVADASGNGNSTSVSGTTSWTTGKVGGALKLNGSSGYIPLSYIPIGAENALSVSFWTKVNALPASDQSSFFVRSQDPGAIWSVIMNLNTNGTMQLGVSSGSDYLVSTSAGDALSVGTWYHISMTAKAGETAKVYINGILIAETSALSSSFTFRGTAPGIKIGAWPGVVAGRYLNGVMDDVRVYDYARTSGQIIEDMNASHPIGGSPVGSQVAYWKLDEGYGTTANDSSINSNSLTLSGANWTNAGKFGKAWDGNGSRYLSRVDDVDFDFTATDDFAYSMWFKSDSASNPGATEYLIDKESTSAGYALYANTDGTICFGIDDDTTWGPDIASCTTADYYDGTWHHIAGVRDYSGTDKTYIYIDGLLKDSDSDSTTATLANSDSLTVGDRNATDDGDEFTGNLDEIKVYRGTLTASTIKIDYNRGASLVFGAVGNNSNYAANAANQEYCVPGDSTSCAAPVAEWKMDEKSGVSAFDTSGNANTGTLTFGPTWTIGKVGAGIKFDGSNDYVDLGTGSSMRPSYVTVSAWIKTSATSQFVLSSNHVATSKFGYALYINDTGLVRMTADGVSSALTLLTGTTAVNDNQWHYITGIYDGSKVYIYVDGRQDVTPATYAAGVLEYDSGSSVLGSYYPAGGYYFNGVIDNMRVYDYARTLAQIQWDYNRGAPIAHYRLDECAGTVANDASGNGYTGTITIGASGTQTSAGTCSSGTSTEAWNNGTTGKLNSSLKFDGTDDYISVTDNSNLENAVMSLSAWIYTSAGFPAQTGIIGKRVTSSDFLQYELGISSNTLYWLQSADGGSWATLVSTPSNTISAGWHHYVGTNNGTTARLYIDGKEVGTADSSPATTLASSTETLQIGQSRIGSNDNYFVGQIDDVRIYNYALTTTQIKNIMNGDFAVRYAPATGQP